MTDSRYWATVPTDEIAAEVKMRADRYYKHLEHTGRLQAWRTVTATYYSKDQEGSWRKAALVEFGGDDGEVVLQKANHFGSLLDHILVLATASRPSFSCRAVNSDFQSQSQATLGDGLIDWYLTEEHVEDRFREGLRRGLLLGEGWGFCGWDPTKGQPVTSQERPLPGYEAAWDGYQQAGGLGVEKPPTYQHQVMTGDVDIAIHHPIDVIRDTSRKSPHDHQWLILRKVENRWDLGMTYPEHREKIQQAESGHSKMAMLWDDSAERGDDDVCVYHLFHDRTPAVPEGRYAIIVADVCVFDGPLPYDGLPLRALTPSQEMDAAFGYTRMWDVHPLQQGYEAALSTLATNNDALGMVNVHVQPDSNFSVTDLGTGIRLWETTAKPEVIDLNRGGEASYKLAEFYKTDMEVISGVNSVARGEPQASLKSGSALALVHSMAMQYNSGVQETYGAALEWVMTRIIKLLQTFATSPRIAEIAGKRRKPIMREFTGGDIAQIRRVKVELGSAISRTTAGRKEIADKLFESKAIDAEQYFEVLATGRLDPVLERPRSQRALVDKENEELLAGRPVRALWTDKHSLHMEHLSLLDEPSVRENDALVKVILDHAQEHLDFRQAMTPYQAEITGQDPIMSLATPPPGGPGAPPPPPPGGPMMGAPMPEVQATVPGVTDAPAQSMGVAVDQAKMPAMPVNPMTGVPANPAGGVQ